MYEQVPGSCRIPCQSQDHQQVSWAWLHSQGVCRPHQRSAQEQTGRRCGKRLRTSLRRHPRQGESGQGVAGCRKGRGVCVSRGRPGPGRRSDLPAPGRGVKRQRTQYLPGPVPRNNQAGNPGSIQKTRTHQLQQSRSPVGAAHSGPPGRLQDQPLAMGEGSTRFVCRARSDRSRANDRGAGAGNQGLQVGGVLEPGRAAGGSGAPGIHREGPAVQRREVEGRRRRDNPWDRRWGERCAVRRKANPQAGEKALPGSPLHHKQTAAGRGSQVQLFRQEDHDPGPATLRRRGRRR